MNYINPRVTAFLSLPDTALPSAMFLYPDGAAEVWGLCAWDVLREHVASGQSIASLCDSPIRLRADVDGWRDGVTV